MIFVFLVCGLLCIACPPLGVALLVLMLIISFLIWLCSLPGKLLRYD